MHSGIKMNILSEYALPQIKSGRQGFGVAIDIGTTTIVVYIFDFDKSKLVGTASCLNTQSGIGIDVISRIKYCADYKDGLAILNKAVVSDINTLINQVVKKHDIQNDKIKSITVTGNTTMLHLFANLSPVSMGRAPFEPLSLFGDSYSAEELGLNAKGACVHIVPCISAFTGGDLTSAILASGLHKSEKPCALMDIGTNGEIAVGGRHGIFAASTAAGPAFEGAHIHCGMAAVPGAIDSVYLRKGNIEFTTIGGRPPRGICGSGLLDAVALALDIGIVDNTGKIAGESEINGRLYKYTARFMGQPAFAVAPGIIITQKDIREVQTAKAAIAAGFQTLLDYADIKIDQIKKLYLAGGFGNFMNSQTAVRIGLVPKEAKDKINTIGNAAGAGAVMSLLDEKHTAETQRIASTAKHIELSQNKSFFDRYINNMNFFMCF